MKPPHAGGCPCNISRVRLFGRQLGLFLCGYETREMEPRMCIIRGTYDTRPHNVIDDTRRGKGKRGKYASTSAWLSIIPSIRILPFTRSKRATI